MSTDPQLLRAEAFQEIGQIIERDASIVVDDWCRRARYESANAARAHHDILRDGLLKLLAALGQGLATINPGDTCQHHFLAVEHGEQRWEAGWSLAEVVQDYQLLRLVLLEHLEQALDRPMGTREVLAVGLALDEAITASVGMYVKYRDEFTRSQEHERADAERRSHQALRRWEQIFQGASWGIALLDPDDYRLIALNPTFAQMHGCSPAELIGRSFVDLAAPEFRDVVARSLLRARVHDHEQFESCQLAGNAESLPVLATVSAIRSPTGDIEHLVVSFQDLRERKALEESLRAQTEALAASDRRKDEFLATLAHELRNPLTPILNVVEILRMPGLPATAAAESLDIADRQLKQVMRLVDDLLDVSRISQGKVALRKVPLDVQAAIRSAVESSRPAIAAANHELQVDCPAEPLTVDADPVRLSQILTNLLNNAARYTRPNGTILISARREQRQVSICVSDNGIGIDGELLPRIFELFVQSENSGQPREGLGVGLALVQRLVQLHGGTVEAASAGPGQGSQFTVCLPLPERTETVSVEPTPSAIPMSNKRVLLVDDNRDVVNMLALLLKRVGHQVSVAHDGAGALDVAQAERPEVVLLDIGLPGLNGYEVAAELRKQPELGPIWLIAMTGYGQEEDVRRAQEAGFDHHLLKPVRLEEIQQVLARCVPGQSRA